MTGRRAPTIAAMLALAAALPPARIVAQTDEQQELERVQAELVELEGTLARQIEQRDDGMAELRRIELALASTQAEIRSLGAAIDEQSERQAEIAAEQRAAGERLAAERDALSEQARMTYMTGPQAMLKLMLSQESPADFGRMLSYYDYLNRYRAEQIAGVNDEIARLAELATESEKVRAELESLQGEQQARAARFETEQRERTALLADLDAEIESQGGRIEQMRAQEAALQELIERLAEVRGAFAVNSEAPFADQQGELPWPVEGELIAHFGDKRVEDGAIRWDADLIEAPAGTPVRAIYHGRVLFANWSSHMGLLVIIDHGDGYWSLYGHNGALTRDVNDWVQAGDVIAEVGNTGGRAEPALYFSILEDGEPVDPADWVR
jgi:septal ring factor EnvC (AmiA/AmiB activator)